MSLKLSKICTALREGLLIDFQYSDKPRVVEVHSIGVTAKDSLVFRGWQLGDEPGWRLFDVEKLQSDVGLRDEASQAPRPGYKTGDSALRVIIEELAA